MRPLVFSYWFLSGWLEIPQHASYEFVLWVPVPECLHHAVVLRVSDSGVWSTRLLLGASGLALP